MYYPTRRNFLKKASGLCAGMAATTLIDHAAMTAIHETNRQKTNLPAKTLAQDEDYWKIVRQAYRVSPDFINLENGYYTLAAEPVVNAQVHNLRMINTIPSYYMRRQQQEDRDRVRNQLAAFAGCSPEEIVVCRNTTEALDAIILGLDMQPGDESIMTHQDYGSMLEAFAMRARRFGSVNKLIELPLDPVSDEEIVAAFEKAITPKTKVMLVTHLINITGQILPVQKIADRAHAHGVEVISDSAHAFAHIDFKIPDLHCDYFGASLHKWLGAPLGAGLMYIKKEKIKKVWPLFGDNTYANDDIRKFEHTGTQPRHVDMSITDALNFHNSIGSARKEARLRYLTSYWIEKVRDIPGIIINTPSQPERYCGIGNVGIKDVPPSELADTLFEKYNIFTVAIDNEAVKGVRVTPHLYNKLEDLDQLVAAIQEIART